MAAEKAGQAGGKGIASFGGGAPWYPSFIANPYSMGASKISEYGTNADAFRLRVHRQAIRQAIHSELWYEREGAWSLFPAQPVAEKNKHPVLNWSYQQPATFDFEVWDAQGLLTPENQESSYNYDSVPSWDPLIDEARKIVFRVGVFCWENIVAGASPSSTTLTLNGSGGTVTKMTNGSLENAATTPLAPSEMAWYHHSNSVNEIVYDLGGVASVKHAAIRLIQRSALTDSILPSTIQVLTSRNGTTWDSFPVMPVDDDNTNNLPGDWGKSPDGVAVEIATCDLDIGARYVKFRIFASDTGNVMIDEIVVYGGASGDFLGANVFTGYLGDKIDIGNDGKIACSAVDVLKKMGDNNEAQLTAHYVLSDTMDIASSLCQSTSYWNGLNTYQTGFTNTEIGWFGGVSGLVYPTYQGQTNAILGYVQELFPSIGYYFYGDGNGYLQAIEPPYRQYQPSRIMAAGLSSNNDARACVRHRTGKNMRNVAEVSSGAVASGGSGTITLFEPNSRNKYGSRRSKITDPILTSPDLRKKAAEYFLRDYAWRLQDLETEINPDFDTQLKQVHAFRAPARPNLYSKASSFSGNRRKGEMWMLNTISQHFTPAEWWGSCSYSPYFPFAIGSPEFISLSPGTGSPDPVLSMRAAWNALTDPHAVTVNIYVCSTSETGTYFKVGSTAASNTDYLITTSDGSTALIFGDEYWVYLTTVGDNGLESLPSVVLNAIIGGVAAYTSCWTVGDFAVGLVERGGPDIDGYYSYHFNAQWSSPSCGFKRMGIYLNPFVAGSQTADPTGVLKGSWAFYTDDWEWHGDYIPPGMEWDRVTPGNLTWEIYFRSKHNFTAGEKMYFRIFTSSARGVSPAGVLMTS